MSRFNELLHGYLHDSLSDSELEEFFSLVEANDSLLNEHMIRETGFEQRHAGLTDRMLREKMLLRVRAQARATQQRVVHLRRWLAAAAVLILLGTGAWFFQQRANKRLPLAKAPSFKNDVAPGTNGAILQLADGSKITLDSAGKDMVIQQGNTQVIRQGNGGVAYQLASQGPSSQGPSSQEPPSQGQASPGQEKSPAVMRNTLSTGKGKQFQVTLPDGTKVWLNSSSSLSYPTSFTGGQRQVEMTGEAYFEVAHDAKKPFIVKADKEDITVLGTNFNINAYADEPALKATLLEGSVRVSNTSGKVLITPGQQASVLHNTTRISTVSVNVEDVIAWKNGYFNFDNVDLQTVMRQLARWYDVEVKYSGPVPSWGDFKGEIGRNLSLAQVLKILGQTRVHFRIEEDKRIVIFP
ncbi:MAG TPA: FecR domain-containing protein [Puia sp.]|nr:FecR domain-containing protein [Puia sp.]